VKGDPPVTVRIAVVIPTYRRPELLLRAIDSVYAASAPGLDISVTVVDNCSPESPVEAVRQRFGARVTVVVNEANLGMPGNWTRCRELAQASGAKYWIMLEDDNLLEPDYFSTAVAALEGDQESDIFFSACTYFDDHGSETPWQMWSVQGGMLRPGRQADCELLGWIFSCAMRLSAVMVRNTEALRGLPTYAKEHYANDDVSGLGMLSIAARGIQYSDRPLMRYRVHPQTVTAMVARDRNLLFAELLRAVRENAVRLARSKRLHLQQWAEGARHAPVDRLMVAVLATSPGGERALVQPHRALTDVLVARSLELRGPKRHASRLLGRSFWRLACML
jgi:glycosyltransferase involved in cell wall biosynthesis